VTTQQKEAEMSDEKADVRELPREGVEVRIKWDDANLKTSYANVCHVSSTREEVTLLFGINQGVQGTPAGPRDVTVQLSDRVIVSPFAAKRLLRLLDGVLREYEARFGALEVETRPAARAVKN
jgi:hypothetical protein